MSRIKRDHRRRFLVFAVPALMVAVACFQRYLVYSQHLSSWRGAGFGMFASMPPSKTRVISVTFVMPSGQEIRFLPSALERRVPLNWNGSKMRRLQTEALTMPSQERLQSMARQIAEVRWVTGRQSIGSEINLFPKESRTSTQHSDEPPFPLKSIRVDYWEYRYDSETNQMIRFNPFSATEPVKVPQSGRES